MSAHEGIVLSRVGGRYHVFDSGETLIATIRGRMKHGSGDRILVGDRVRFDVHPDGSATIESVCPRHSVLRRRGPGRSRGARAIAANVDQVIVVGAARRPDWDPQLIDRFVAVAEANDLAVVVVVNKADLDPRAESRLEPYCRAGYAGLVTSVPGKQGLETLRGKLEGRISLLTGPTGSGKSSLLNVLQPGLRLRTTEVSRRGGTGRHTTVSAEMHPFAGSGFVVDTPGLRDVGLWGVSPAEVAGAFPDLAKLNGRCRFDDCRHLTEPGCAVVAAVEQGEVDRTRLDSYRRLLEEASRAAQPWL